MLTDDSNHLKSLRLQQRLSHYSKSTQALEFSAMDGQCTGAPNVYVIGGGPTTIDLSGVDNESAILETSKLIRRLFVGRQKEVCSFLSIDLYCI